MTTLIRTCLNSSRRLGRRLARFRRDNSGIAALEFALIAPVMVFLYIGLYQISFLIQQDRSVSHATSVMGDLITRVGTADDRDLEDVMQAAIEIIDVSNTDTLINDIEMDISSFQMDASGAAISIGRASTAGSTFSPVAASSLDSRMLNQQIGAVVVRIRYNYKMLSHASADDLENVNRTQYIDEDGIMLAEQFIMRPRVSNAIPFGTDPDNPRDYTCSISGDRLVSCS